MSISAPYELAELSRKAAVLTQAEARDQCELPAGFSWATPTELEKLKAGDAVLVYASVTLLALAGADVLQAADGELEIQLRGVPHPWTGQAMSTHIKTEQIAALIGLASLAARNDGSLN